VEEVEEDEEVEDNDRDGGNETVTLRGYAKTIYTNQSHSSIHFQLTYNFRKLKALKHSSLALRLGYQSTPCHGCYKEGMD
jgi:hypothetical protein